MKTSFQQCRNRKCSGSILVLSLLIAGVIGFTLASYLSLVSAQNRSVFRSQTWNATMPLIEAGIEEALAHLNENCMSNYANLYTQGWQQEGSLAVRRRAMGDGGYVVSIRPAAQPIIECTAWLPAPVAFASVSPTMFAQTGTQPYYPKKNYIYRSVRVATGGGAIFAKAMIAKGAIDMNGNNVSSDSFDSADSNYSTNGRYDPAKRKDGGDVATNSGQRDIFNAGNANIRGRVASGPGGNVVTGPNSSIGSMGWVNSGTPGIEPGYFTDDMNMSFPDVTPPFTSGISPRSGIVTNYAYTYSTTIVSTATLPIPVPPGTVTNFSTITSSKHPGWGVGSITTNVSVITTTNYPDDFEGRVLTNIAYMYFTNTYPSPAPSPIVYTNSVTVTNYPPVPSPAPIGTVYVLSFTTSACPSSVSGYNKSNANPPPDWGVPAPGTYLGPVTKAFYNGGSEKYWYVTYSNIVYYYYPVTRYAFAVMAYTYTATTYTYSGPAISYDVPTVVTNVSVVGSTSYNYVLDDGDYVIGSLSGTVYVRGKARLLVTDSINITGQGGITIGPNGSLELYMAGTSAKIAGKGVVNQTGNASRFLYYGLPTHTDLSISGNGEFAGAIYAPNAAFTLNGGGSNTEDFIGASVTASVRMNGHFNFHYDENLSRIGPRSRYLVTSWNEVAPTETALVRSVGLDNLGPGIQ